MTWQPISTAPKDGTWVLLRDDEPRGRRYRDHVERAVCVAFWKTFSEPVDEGGGLIYGKWCCARWSGGWTSIWPDPVEWMPIPK